MSRETAVVIAPGRGVYGAKELGYLARRHAGKTAFLETVDAVRAAHGHESVRTLDAMDRYAAGVHASSENASALIYACALADFADIDRDRFDIVAVTGNSLGWYLALAAGGALRDADGIRLVDTMGGLMQAEGVGGQLVYPAVDADWRADPARAETIAAALEAGRSAGEAHISIRLGGLMVLAGDEPGLAAMEAALPEADGRYPFRLARHAAFHTPLLAHVAATARDRLGPNLFQPPTLPLIDGRGVIWTPLASDLAALRAYTLDHQITRTYDFTRAIQIAVREFAPDRLIVLGPGDTLGGAIAQTLIAETWRGLASKADFAAAQANDPFLLAMGRDDQRTRVAASEPA